MQNKSIKKGRTLCVGDIHGNHKALLQVLERSKFDKAKDTLISLGDVVDGHSDSFEVVEELLSINNLISIRGNHDDWFYEWIKTGTNPSSWGQGQRATGESYLEHSRPGTPWVGMGYRTSILTNDVPDSHVQFFENQLPYYIDEDNNLFIHGGFNRNKRLEEQPEHVFYWDRDLWQQAMAWKSMKKPENKFKIVENFKEIFIGHTSTEFWNVPTPMNAANIWNLDTGAGWYGKLTIMDLNTKEYWQSDKANELYVDFKGR